MPVQNWINDVETNVLRGLLLVTSTLMSVVCVLIGWGLGQVLVNLLADIYFMKDVFNSGLTLMVAVLFVDSSVEHLLLPFMIYLTCLYQSPLYTQFSDDSTIVANSTQPAFQYY
jgi:hypothetical protein